MSENYTSKPLHSISVVIATLGLEPIEKTIDSINSSTIIPSEILIWIPTSYKKNIPVLNHPNIKVVLTEVKGQVAQRSIGFNRASGDIVMQLDDDLILDCLCIELLMNKLLLQGACAVVSPNFICDSSKLSIYQEVDRNKVFLNFYYWLINGNKGYMPGTISSAGVNFGLNTNIDKSNYYNVEWLAGGCVMHYKNNLVLDNFFPFSGKAFNEDLIHSYLLKEKGCKFFIVKSAVCYLSTISSSDFSVKGFLRNFFGDYKSRKYYVKLSSKSMVRMHFFYFFWVASYFSDKLSSLIKKL